MIRVGDLSQFSVLKGGELVAFPLDVERTVRITFNAPQRTVLNVVPMHGDGTFPADEDPLFLAVVEGLDDVEFYAMGAFALHAEADRVWYRTMDSDQVHAVVPDAETFTRIAERRVRNPDMEAIEAKMHASMERRMGLMYEDIRRERQRLNDERHALDTRARAPGLNQPASEPAAGAGEPAGSAAPPASGEAGGADDA